MDEPSMGLAPALAITGRAYVLQSARIMLDGRAVELSTSDALRRAYLG
jgi:ABC-type branched-subunit amino acid transport system ATPase component